MSESGALFGTNMRVLDAILDALPASERSRDFDSVYKNVSKKLEISPETFRSACDRAVMLGLVSNTNGRLARLERVFKEQPQPRGVDWHVEQNLYRPILRYLRLSFPRHPSVSAGFDVFATITANARRRQAVPDLLLLSRYSHTILRYTQPDIYTFEVKTRDNIGMNSPAQAANQGQFANYRYLVWHCSDRRHRDDLKYTLRSYCEALGVGLVLLADPLTHSTYDVMVTAKRHEVDPRSADTTVSALLTPNQNRRIRDWLQRTEVQA